MPSCGVLVAISLALAILILFPFSNLLSLWIHPAHALSDFNFDAVGDWGCNSNTQRTVNNIKGKNPERIIALGDYSYQPTATCWLNAINSIKSVTRINIGNHENDASEGYLYVDGSQIGSRSTSGASPDNLGIQPVRIGANSQSANSFFVGNADEIRIWNRALSSEEVANAYDGDINTSGQVLFIPSSSSITSLKTTAETKLNVTNQTQAPQNVTAQTTASENANNTMTTETIGLKEGNSPKENKLPSPLTPIINNTQTTEKKVPKELNNNVTVDNSNQNAESKPIIPKTTDEDVITGIRNILPEADVKKNLLAVESSQVLLDGSDSRDRDGKIDLYQWQQIKGPKVALENANNIEASFISPQVNHDTILVFKLTIVDDNGGSNSAITTVKVIDNQESPSVPPKIPDPSISNPEDKSVKTGDVINSTGE